MPRYKCVGCGEIHNDNDYSKEDGDILVSKEFSKEDAFKRNWEAQEVSELSDYNKCKMFFEFGFSNGVLNG